MKPLKITKQLSNKLLKCNTQLDEQTISVYVEHRARVNLTACYAACCEPVNLFSWQPEVSGLINFGHHLDSCLLNTANKSDRFNIFTRQK